jgi:enamine deaminase RidA (YjgF/YER057c/UK114 family)
MTVIRHNPAGVFPPYRAYAHATEVRGDARLLFVSGLNGCEADGKTLPESFDAQAELIWKHLGTILASAGMEYRRRGERSDAGEAPRNPSGVAHVVCCRLLDPSWKLEMEAVAAACSSTR